MIRPFSRGREGSIGGRLGVGVGLGGVVGVVLLFWGGDEVV